MESTRAPAIKKGWMTKQGRGGLVKNWKKRFFVLMAGKIQYYVNEAKEYPFGDVMKGEMSLVNTEINEEDKQNPAQIFVASFNGENSMLMQAASREEAIEWRNAILQHIRFANSLTEETVSRISRRTVPTTSDPSSSTTAAADSASPSKAKTTDAAAESNFTEPEKSPDEAAIQLFDKCLAFCVDSTRRSEMISSFLPTLQSVCGNILESFNTGDMGSRGEEYLIAATCMVAIVIFGFIPKISFLIELILRLLGTVMIVVGITMMLNAAFELNDKCSPWLQPSKNTTKIVTGGVYGVVRHPMYGGCILLCFGLSMLQQHVYKCIAAIALSIVLNKAAEIEEEALEKAFPKDYPTYASHRKAFVPFFY